MIPNIQIAPNSQGVKEIEKQKLDTKRAEKNLQTKFPSEKNLPKNVVELRAKGNVGKSTK